MEFWESYLPYTSHAVRVIGSVLLLCCSVVANARHLDVHLRGQLHDGLAILGLHLRQNIVFAQTHVLRVDLGICFNLGHILSVELRVSIELSKLIFTGVLADAHLCQGFCDLILDLFGASLNQRQDLLLRHANGACLGKLALLLFVLNGIFDLL